MAQEVFQRYEKKYRITAEQYQELVSYLVTKMEVDSYGKHTICNIYFDTPDYQLIRASLDKPVYKEKIRLRSYGISQDKDPVFLELKKKYDGVVYKRRAVMRLKDAQKYIFYGILPETPGQILREIDYSCQFYKARPKVYLAYDRIAMAGREDPQLRVTFDTNIRARDYHLDLKRGTYGSPLLDKGEFLMEVKLLGSMPVWMSHLLSELSIYPTSFSKYGTYYCEYLTKQTTGGRISA